MRSGADFSITRCPASTRQPSNDLALPGLARPLTDEWQHEVFFTFQVNVVRDAQSVNARKRMRDKRQKPRARPSGVSAGVHAGGLSDRMFAIACEGWAGKRIVITLLLAFSLASLVREVRRAPSPQLNTDPDMARSLR